MPIKNRLADMHAEITGWRRHLHAHPELDFDVHETAKFVEEKLRSFGVTDITTGVGRSGVVAVIEGRETGSGRAIGLRADMDALPIVEATGLDYASKVHGRMHACGHDGHTAMLLGAAQYLAETRNFNGRAVLIFQPAEEGGGGGLEMCRDGMMERWGIDEVYGMHTHPGEAVGGFHIRVGAQMAAADQFDIVITGKGGHAAEPHKAVDPNVAAAHVIVALQSIASRSVDPLAQVVVSVCMLRSDSEAHNVIPQQVTMKGTVRSLDADVRDLAQRRLEEIVDLTARAQGCTAETIYDRGYPVTINSPGPTAHAIAAAQAVTADVNPNTAPIMAAEDFSYMAEERPGAFIMLGNGFGPNVHHAQFNFDDEAIPAGCSYLAEVIERGMPI
jgi:hippurate hydrolase